MSLVRWSHKDLIVVVLLLRFSLHKGSTHSPCGWSYCSFMHRSVGGSFFPPLTSQLAPWRSEMNWLISEQGLLAMCFSCHYWIPRSGPLKMNFTVSKTTAATNRPFCLRVASRFPLVSSLPKRFWLVWLVCQENLFESRALARRERCQFPPPARSSCLNSPGSIILAPPVIRCVHVRRAPSSQYRLLLFNDSP